MEIDFTGSGLANSVQKMRYIDLAKTLADEGYGVFITGCDEKI